MTLSISRWCVLILSCAAVTALADDPTSTPAAKPSVPALSGKLGTPIQLFNGKDLDGWVWYQRPPRPGKNDPAEVKLEDVWTVKDGVLHLKGKPNGYLRNEKEFKNYVLTVEERHVTKGNGGLLIGIKPPDKIWPGLEIQTMTDNAGDLWNHNLLKMTTDPARTPEKDKGHRVVKMGPDSQKPVGEWEVMEVTVDNGNLIYTVNGQLQNLATETEDLAGQVGLQSEGAEMEFRKVQITPILPSK
jgi:Domain of Unknown Function (DUF1080)